MYLPVGDSPLASITPARAASAISRTRKIGVKATSIFPNTVTPVAKGLRIFNPSSAAVAATLSSWATAFVCSAKLGANQIH